MSVRNATIAAALLALICGALAGVARAGQSDPRLDGLFESLEQASASAEAAPIEQQIWSIWFEAPDTHIESLMSDGRDALRQGDFAGALASFDAVVAEAPDYAEGWNQRATVRYLMNDLDASLADIAKTLELEPRHFGALSGRGLVYVKRGDLEKALESFEAALAVNPQMPGPRINAEALRRALKQREI